MKALNMLFAGFGGQGLLFAGKVAAYAGMLDGKFISWLPSYGPEMRGGTANCSVCIDDKDIGSPLVLTPDVLITMNNPSFEKFIDTVIPGGTVIIDSTLVTLELARTDVNAFFVPATKMAEENGIQGLANIILLGKFLKESGFCSAETMDKALIKSVPKSKPEMLDFNRKAIKLGMEA